MNKVTQSLIKKWWEGLKDHLTHNSQTNTTEIGGNLEVDGNITQNGGKPLALYVYQLNFSNTYLNWYGNIDLTDYDGHTIINEDSTWALNDAEIRVFVNALTSGYCDITTASVSSDFAYISRSAYTTVDISSLKVSNNIVIPGNTEYYIDFDNKSASNPSEYELVFNCIRLI